MLNEKLYNELQFGFRKRNSTTETLIFCTEKSRKEINDKKFVSIAFLDLSKALDSINHEILYSQLKYLGLN